MSSLHLICVPNIAVYFLFHNDFFLPEKYLAFAFLLFTNPNCCVGAYSGGRVKFFAAWDLHGWLTAPHQIIAQNIVGHLRPWCTSSVLLLFYKAQI